MSQKTKGTVTFVCGIIMSVSGAIVLIIPLVLGVAFQDTYSSLMYLLWIALVIYLCYLGSKMRKNGSAGKDCDDK